MSTVEYLPVAVASGSNVDTQVSFAGSGYQETGFVAGAAQSKQLNKVWRQSSMFASAFANWISGVLAVDVLDNGDRAALTTLIDNAVQAKIGAAISAITVVATPESALAVMPGRFRSTVYGPFATPRMISITIHSDGGPGANSDLELVAGANSGSMVTVSGNAVHNGGGFFSACYLLPMGDVYQVNNNANGSAHTDTVVGWSEVVLTLA